LSARLVVALLDRNAGSRLGRRRRRPPRRARSRSWAV